MATTAKITNLTEMSLNRAIIHMALPASAAMLVQSLYHLVDSYWIGKLGAEPLAAVSATSFLIWMMFSLADISAVAANALVARAVGSGQSERVREYVRQCLIISVAVSTILMAIGLPLRRLFFRWLGLEEEVIGLAETYLTPWLLSLPIMMLVVPISATFRGIGDARTPMLMMAVLVVLNAVLDPLFIFGWGPIPALGVAGAAWVTAFNHLVFVVMGGMILARRGLWPRIRGLGSLKIAFGEGLQIVRIGLPIALNGALFSLTYVGLTWVLARFGSVAVAAIGMGHRIEAYPWFVAYGFSLAAASLVGQYLGAGKPKDAEWAVWKTAMIASVFIGTFIAIVFLWVEPIVRLFIDDPAVVAEAGRYIRIAAVCWSVGLLEVIMEGAFSGAGNTLPPLLIAMPITVMRIPIAYVLAVTLGMGPLGVWLSIGGTMVVKGVLLTGWFLRGGWKKISVQ